MCSLVSLMLPAMKILATCFGLAVLAVWQLDHLSWFSFCLFGEGLSSIGTRKLHGDYNLPHIFRVIPNRKLRVLQSSRPAATERERSQNRCGRVYLPPRHHIPLVWHVSRTQTKFQAKATVFRGFFSPGKHPGWCSVYFAAPCTNDCPATLATELCPVTNPDNNFASCLLKEESGSQRRISIVNLWVEQ